MRIRDAEGGFTLVETLFATLVFSLISVAFYQVLVSQQRGVDATRDLTRLTDEARLGFNRMVRDTREGDALTAATGTSFTVRVNYNGDGVYENPTSDGVYEILTYAYDAVAGTITLNGSILMTDVAPLTPGADVFTYSSNNLEYDWGGDGLTTWLDVDQAVTHGHIGVGDNSASLTAAEIPYLTTVGFSLQVGSGGQATPFYAKAQMRNRV
jgi:type II secretory pathway pseudopilin PulG